MRNFEGRGTLYCEETLDVLDSEYLEGYSAVICNHPIYTYIYRDVKLYTFRFEVCVEEAPELVTDKDIPPRLPLLILLNFHY